jgi:serine/threonine protein kinase
VRANTLSKEPVNLYYERFKDGIIVQRAIHKLLEELDNGLYVPYVYKIIETPQKCLVQEWIEGVGILEYLKSKNDIKETLSRFLDLLYGLNSIHQVGFIHRDIKASNLMMGESTYNNKKVRKGLFLLDWSISKELGRYLTVPLKEGLGTPGYATQKQFNIDASASTEKDDIFSLGVVLWEFIRQQNIPLVSLDIYNDKSKFQAFIISLGKDLPEQLLMPYIKSTAIEENARYSSIEEFIKDLEEICKSTKDFKIPIRQESKVNNEQDIMILDITDNLCDDCLYKKAHVHMLIYVINT